MRSRISLNPDTVSLELELPWELAEELAARGPAIIDQLRAGLARAKADDESRAKLAALHDDTRRNRIDQWRKLARKADRHARRFAELGYPTEYQALKALGAEFGISSQALRALVSGHRRRERDRRDARQASRIIRLHLLGHTHAQIARQLRPHRPVSRVTAVLHRHDDLIGALRSYEEKLRPARGVVDVQADTVVSDGASGPGDYERQLAARRAWLRELSVQLYRRYRRVEFDSPQCRRAWSKCEGEAHTLHPELILNLVRERQQAVSSFLKRRRDARIVELRASGLKQREIAARVGRSQVYVSKVLVAHRKAGA